MWITDSFAEMEWLESCAKMEWLELLFKYLSVGVGFL